VFWSSTQRDHVIYESRLDLAVLLLADFDQAVCGIVAQPFLLKAAFDGRLHRHVPDFLLLTDTGPVVVDVKPQHLVAEEKIAATLAWTNLVVQQRGWRYEVRSEPPPRRLANVRFLAGYRRDWLFDPVLLAELRAVDMSVRRWMMRSPACPSRAQASVRAAVLHLLWVGHLTTDLDRPLSRSHVLRAAQ
jgi:hypothetical protein